MTIASRIQLYSRLRRFETRRGRGHRAVRLVGFAMGIRSIELGSTHGFASNALGSVWIDDLTID